MKRLVSKNLPLVLLAVTLPNMAHAYVDPGSGHLLLQLLLAFMAGALFYARSIMQWLGVGRTRSTPAPETKSAANLETAEFSTVAAPAVVPRTTSRAKKSTKSKTSAKKSGGKKVAARKRA